MNILHIDLGMLDLEIAYQEAQGIAPEFIIMNSSTLKLLENECMKKCKFGSDYYKDTSTPKTCTRYRGLWVAICEVLEDGEVEVK